MTSGHQQRRRLVLLSLLCTGIFFLSMLLGRYPEPGFISIQKLFDDSLALRIFLRLRIPRVLAAATLGAGLAMGGSAFQMLFRNPLVEPGFLGVTQGAGFGAALAILLFPAIPGSVQLSAILFSLLGLTLSYRVANRLPFGGWIIRMVISGLTVSALFTAAIGVIKYMADPLSQLQEMTFWMMGGLEGITWAKTLSMLATAFPGMLLLFIFRWRINILSLDDMTSFSIGANPARERLLLLTAASIVTAGVTAVAGIIGWVGLLVPHIARRLVGPDARASLPASALIGAVMVLVCDDVARTLMVFEIPLGILTSLSGAGLFLALLAFGKVRFHR